MNINNKLNTSSTDSFLVNTKAVLMEARLERLSSVSSDYGRKRTNAAYNFISRRASNNTTKTKNISNKSIHVHDARSSRGNSCRQSSRSSSRSPFSAEATLADVDDCLRELKQVKSNIMKEIESKKSKGSMKTSLTDSEMNTIQFFMKACELMLKSFDKQPQHDAEECKFERYEKRQTTRQRSFVRFDLSQNEFFSY